MLADRKRIYFPNQVQLHGLWKKFSTVLRLQVDKAEAERFVFIDCFSKVFYYIIREDNKRPIALSDMGLIAWSVT